VLRFLADESCDFAVVAALRNAGYDVTAVAELSPAAIDDAVLALAHSESRVLLTEDKDFGMLAYAGRRQTAGVLLIRFPARARTQLAPKLLQIVGDVGERLIGSFAVVEPARVRISRLPGFTER
jgi:predicted nuclease of predicted toxin-antitoxin system